MHRFRKWLLALSVATLAMPAPLWAAEEGGALDGKLEVGAASVNITGDESRVNEYSTIRTDDGAGAYGKVELEGHKDGVAVDLAGEFFESDNMNYEFGFDAKRRVRLKSSYDEFEHKLDHDRIDYLNAGIPSGKAAGSFLQNTYGNKVVVQNPLGTKTIGTYWALPAGVTPDSFLSADLVPGLIGQGASGTWYVLNPASPYYGPVKKDSAGNVIPELSIVPNDPNNTLQNDSVKWQQLGRASILGEDFVPDQDFFVVRKEFENEVDVEVIPNVTLHAGFRVESREGMEQSIGMSKCTTCHITGQSRLVDEETEDLTVGATGKFGLLTVAYSYLNREFRENANSPTRVYDPALAPNPNTQYTAANSTFDNRLLYDYEDGALPYDTTPDSDKDSHVVKVKLDLPHNSSILGSYVNAEVESDKNDEPGIFDLHTDKLKTTYDGYGLKASTRLGKRLTLKLHGKVEEIESDAAEATFFPMAQTSASIGGLPGNPVAHREAASDRDVATLGLDGIYRLGRGATLRLGYEFEEVDREVKELGETETQTVKATLKVRPAKKLTARVGYTYQNIDDPFHNPDAADYVDPITGESYFDKGTTTGFTIGSGPTYGTDYYDLRDADLSNLPEDVHEGKFSATWAAASNFSTTVTYRGRFEENELTRSTWEQETHSPGISFWYAPSEKVNLTFLYNYLGQRTESKFCQGWYDG